MSMIKIENLTFSYPTSYDNVFENVSFQVDTDWKLGFVGRNGRGKTTFLNLLLGKYEYSGKILSSVQFDYFPYPVSDKNRITEDILQEICPLAEEWELMRELSYLDVDVDVLWRPFETLSNGEQTKVLIAALFLNEGHFLLIDEPTNHLDAKARKSVAAYLKKKKGFILVSHDRRFLDDCVDYILSINRANIEVQRGNFSSWMSNFERQQEFELAQNERLQKDIRRLQQSAKRAAVWSERVEASKIGAADKGYVGHISDSSLGVLYTLLDAEAPCSQYDLCSEWSIPKQTINTAVAALQKKGVAFLSPIPGTRNKKNIAFTEFGRDFAEKTVGILRMAELDALAELSPEERELYIRLNEKYNCRLIEKLYRIMDEVNQDRKDCD